jgi:hypothetical protein
MESPEECKDLFCGGTLLHRSYCRSAGWFFIVVVRWWWWWWGCGYGGWFVFVVVMLWWRCCVFVSTWIQFMHIAFLFFL